MPGRALRLVWLLGTWLPEVQCDYFPFAGVRPLIPRGGDPVAAGGADAVYGQLRLQFTRHSRQWQAPELQPWDPLRATSTSVTVSWTVAWNPWCDVAYYELQARRPAGPPLALADRLGLQFREADVEVDVPFSQQYAMQDEAWTAWQTQYKERGRVFIMAVQLGSAHAVQFRVRACGKVVTDGCSDWSRVQTAHTVLSAAQDMVNFHVRGTGKNGHNYTVIEVNRKIIYKRRDETGLVLAVFSRLDFSLQWLRTYDTHRSREQALRMSKDIRQFNESFFIVVASAIAWEWHAPQSLVKTLEFCGAYHFGQWAHTFAEQAHYSSPNSDLQQTASQDEFGHPYALVGIPGIGTGNGWESLMHNTGHYLPRNVRPQDAVIRGVAYYDYVFRLYRLQDVFPTKVDFYLKATPPPYETLHSPIPKAKRLTGASVLVPAMQPAYVPYIGALQSEIETIIEANETVPPYNFAFLLMTNAEVWYVDPRPRSRQITEIERIWEGPSARYWPNNGTLFSSGLPLESRSCVEFMYYNFHFASPDSCGLNFDKCCSKIDTPMEYSMACGIGIAPTLCKSSDVLVLSNVSQVGKSKWPYPFRVIDWTS